MMKIAKTVRALTATAVLSALYGTAGAETLMEVYELARDNDAQYRTITYNYEAALENRDQARSAFLPQIGASGSAGFVELVDDNDGPYESTELSLSLSQNLYNRTAQIASKQADLTIAQAQAQLSAAEQDLIFRAASAYFGVLSAKENLVYARSERKAIEQQLEQANRRFEVGLIAITDVKEAQAAYDLAIASEIVAENDVADAREALRVMTGLEIEEYMVLAEDAPLIRPDPEDVSEWVRTAESSNLTLRVAEYDAELANKEIESARSGHYPVVALGAGYTDSHTNGSSGDSEYANIGLQVDLPFYSGGRVSSETRQAKSLAQAAAEQYELTRRNTVQATRNAYRGVLASISQVRALEQALQSTRTAAEATQTGFEVGTRTAVDVLGALRDTYEARANYSAARYNYIINTLGLKQAAGILSPADVEAVNNWLRPETPADSESTLQE
ncbi:TolC family outer membrane protein [Granulosicoccaceae sp. 1_MG-2023]|nr:TolC family outer membrane protein [Granulosicoccaceae sp. 1_MG-2023]